MDNSPTGRNMTTYRQQLTDHKLTDRLAKAYIDRHNQADVGLRKVGKALEMLKLPSKLIKHCHNQANIGLRKKDRKKERKIMQRLSNVVTTRLAKA
jgi:hypothetical protein